ncbi:hypothetical protein D9M68_857600 [compost metagenome]
MPEFGDSLFDVGLRLGVGYDRRTGMAAKTVGNINRLRDTKAAHLAATGPASKSRDGRHNKGAGERDGVEFFRNIALEP